MGVLCHMHCSEVLNLFHLGVSEKSFCSFTEYRLHSMHACSTLPDVLTRRLLCTGLTTTATVHLPRVMS